MIKRAPKVFHLVLEFNFNNFPQLLKMIAERKNALLSKKSDISVFNYIVTLSDQTTEQEDPLEPLVFNKDQLSEVDEFTRTMVGIRKEVQPIEKAPAAESQEIKDLFAFLDLLETDINLRERFRVEIKDRILSMKIPLKMVGKDPEKTMLRFDPNYFIGSTTFSDNMMEVYVYNDQMKIFAMENPNKVMIVPL